MPILPAVRYAVNPMAVAVVLAVLIDIVILLVGQGDALMAASIVYAK